MLSSLIPKQFVLLITAAAFVISGLQAQTFTAFTVCDGSTGNTSSNSGRQQFNSWRTSLPSGSWTCMRINNDTSFQSQWSLTQYGFVHQLGQDWLNLSYSTIVNNNALRKATFGGITRRRADGTGTDIVGSAMAGLYGWFQPTDTTNRIQDRTTEFYIIESWSPGDKPASTRTPVGTVTSDGITYNVYRVLVTNAPTYNGYSQDFVQYWSVPVSSTQRASGNMTYANHFKKYAELGIYTSSPLRNIMFFVEPRNSYPGNGRIQFQTAVVERPQ